MVEKKFLGKSNQSEEIGAGSKKCCFLKEETSWTKAIDPVNDSLLPDGEVLWGEGNGTPLQYSCLENPLGGGAWWAAVHGVTKSRTRLNDFTFTFHFHALEKEMATHSSVLAWRIPGTGESGGLPSMGSHRVGHDSSGSSKVLWRSWTQRIGHILYLERAF